MAAIQAERRRKAHVASGAEVIHLPRLADLQRIRERHVTLALWDRPAPITPLDLHGFENVRLVTQVDAARAALADALASSPPRGWHVALIEDVAQLTRTYAGILDLNEVEIRLERVASNSCWRFHTDYVTVRLITTYVGRGTEWLYQASAAAHAGGNPVEPQAMPTGSVGLFKGHEWAGEDAIVHRSPPIAGTGEQRLLLVINPIRSLD